MQIGGDRFARLGRLRDFYLIRIHTPELTSRGVQANRISAATPFVQAEPIIVLPYRSINI